MTDMFSDYIRSVSDPELISELEDLFYRMQAALNEMSDDGGFSDTQQSVLEAFIDDLGYAKDIAEDLRKEAIQDAKDQARYEDDISSVEASGRI